MVLESTALLVVVVVYVGVVLWLVRRAGALQRGQTFRFVCPRLQEVVDCRLVQELRIGRWVGVEKCSAFESEALTCDQECVRLMNLGKSRALFAGPIFSGWTESTRRSW